MIRHHLYRARAAFTAIALIVTADAALADTIGYYRFEPSGFLSDSSGNGRDLTNTAGHFSQPLPFGFPNPVPLTGAANTAAVDSVASSPGTLFAVDDDAWTSSAMTIEAFIQPLGLGTATSSVVSHWASGDLSWTMGTRPDGSLRIGLSTNGSGSVLRDAFEGQLQGGKSYYIATSFDVTPGMGPSGSNVYGTMYLRNLTDGGPLMASRFIVSSEFASLFNSSAPMTIGETGNETSPFDGTIDEVRISNTVLSPNQLLVHSDAIPVEYQPFVSVRLADSTVDGTIVSLTVDTGPESTTYMTRDLSGGVLTQFGGAAGSIADMVMPSSATGGPATGTRANLLGDYQVDTGFINLSDWAVAFGDDIVNRPGPDIVLIDWGGTGNPDTVDITIGGVTLQSQSLSTFNIQQSLSGRRYRTASTSLTSVAELEAAAFGGTTPGTSASNNTLLIDLSDFGFAEGAALSTGAEVIFSNGFEIDPVAIFGLLTPSTLEGDFNGDGMVNAADYTVWRDNLNADESLLNGGGDGSGVVDQGDYDLWTQNYGATLTPAPTAIPEPTSAAVVLAALFGLTCATPLRR